MAAWVWFQRHDVHHFYGCWVYRLYIALLFPQGLGLHRILTSYNTTVVLYLSFYADKKTRLNFFSNFYFCYNILKTCWWWVIVYFLLSHFIKTHLLISKFWICRHYFCKTAKQHPTRINIKWRNMSGSLHRLCIMPTPSQFTYSLLDTSIGPSTAWCIKLGVQLRRKVSGNSKMMKNILINQNIIIEVNPSCWSIHMMLHSTGYSVSRKDCKKKKVQPKLSHY